jgi:hypothetical protein
VFGTCLPGSADPESPVFNSTQQLNIEYCFIDISHRWIETLSPFALWCRTQHVYLPLIH